MAWIITDDRLAESHFLLMIGKLVFLCQHFESNCKQVAMWLSLTEELQGRKFAFLSPEHKIHVDLLLNKDSLGCSIKKRLENVFGRAISKSDIAVLEDARKSRNFVCHKSTLELALEPSWGNAFCFKWDEDLYREHTSRLAKGDYLISRWLYEFCEKEPGAFVREENYVATIVGWVFQDRPGD